MPSPRVTTPLALAGAALAAWAGWFEPRRLVVRECELTLPHWPAQLAGLRAGVMSDLHAGVPHAGLRAIRRVVDELNAREPDVHLLLGDYLDASQKLAARRSRPSASPTSSRGCARRSGPSR